MRQDTSGFGSGTRIAAIVLMFVLSAMIASITLPESSGQPAHLYILEGSVFDPDGERVPDAMLKIKNLATGEIMDDQADENGNYSANLANLEEGWEDGDEIQLTGYSSTFDSNTTFVYDDDPGGGYLNVTLPWIIIISPQPAEAIKKDAGNYSVHIEFLSTLEVDEISYTIDSSEFSSTTTNTTELSVRDLKDGTHKIRVYLRGDFGEIPSQEIFFKLEGDEDGSDSNIMFMALLIVVLCVIIGAVLMLKFRPGKEN